ncbi:DUF7000 family protein [Macellibacteroides fermentans]|uniref:DUF7000 family protein n=1 Tax=Macellibacteroides fermentans TaxID=879969 RepID=UPI00406CFF3E
MNSLGHCIREYKIQLSKGFIQKAYKEIMSLMSDLRGYLAENYPDFAISSLYFGYMDMTYFAFTPTALRNRKLKVAIVFLHEECRFEVWLAANNREVQADYIELLHHKDTGKYNLSQIQPGVDSIIAASIVKQPDFDNLDELKRQIETKTLAFAEDMIQILNEGREK